MTVSIDVWFDYICPYSLITRHVFAEALDGRDVVAHWHPFEVNPDCVEEAGEYPRGVWEKSVRPLALERGLVLGGPPGSPLRRARMAFVGYQYALDQNRGDAYTDRVFRAYFHEWQDISDPVVLTRLAKDARLDPTAFRAALMSPGHARRHERSVVAAREEAAVPMVPVVVVGEWRHDGVPTVEQLAAAVDSVAGGAGPVAAEEPPRSGHLRVLPGGLDVAS